MKSIPHILHKNTYVRFLSGQPNGEHLKTLEPDSAVPNSNADYNPGILPSDYTIQGLEKKRTYAFWAASRIGVPKTIEPNSSPP